MLVISRKIGESLIISETIKITVVSAGGDRIAIGIEAPKDIRIIREELAETIEANKTSSEKIDQSGYREIAALIKNKKNNGKEY